MSCCTAWPASWPRMAPAGGRIAAREALTHLRSDQVAGSRRGRQTTAVIAPCWFGCAGGPGRLEAREGDPGTKLSMMCTSSAGKKTACGTHTAEKGTWLCRLLHCCCCAALLRGCVNGTPLCGRCSSMALGTPLKPCAKTAMKLCSKHFVHGVVLQACLPLFRSGQQQQPGAEA